MLVLVEDSHGAQVTGYWPLPLCVSILVLMEESQRVETLIRSAGTFRVKFQSLF